MFSVSGNTGGKNLKSNAATFWMMLLACVLIVLGDVRFIIGSIGYWLAWSVVGFAGFFLTGTVFSRKISVDLFVYLIGFFLVFISFILSGFVNQDMYTLYQGFKMFCVMVIFFCIYINAKRLSGDDFYIISMVCIAVGLCFFLLCKYVYKDFYILLGDGRQGSLFAYPGVLWKTPVFFTGFIISGAIFAGKNKVLALLAVIAAMYLLIMDSSRTGFLIIAMIALLFIMLCAYLKPKLAVICSLLLLISGICLLVLYGGGFISFGHADEPLVLNRLAAGDPIRAKMLLDGITHAEECVPLGCGFGTATSWVDGGPMVVHNAYLSSIGDLGVAGFIGMAVLMISPIVFFLCKIRHFNVLDSESTKKLAFSIAAMGGGIGYAFLLMLHPLSTELSEWGIWIVMVSILSVFSKHVDVNKLNVQAEA